MSASTMISSKGISGFKSSLFSDPHRGPQSLSPPFNMAHVNEFNGTSDGAAGPYTYYDYSNSQNSTNNTDYHSNGSDNNNKYNSNSNSSFVMRNGTVAAVDISSNISQVSRRNSTTTPMLESSVHSTNDNSSSFQDISANVTSGAFPAVVQTHSGGGGKDLVINGSDVVSGTGNIVDNNADDDDDARTVMVLAKCLSNGDHTTSPNTISPGAGTSDSNNPFTSSSTTNMNRNSNTKRACKPVSIVGFDQESNTQQIPVMSNQQNQHPLNVLHLNPATTVTNATTAGIINNNNISNGSSIATTTTNNNDNNCQELMQFHPQQHTQHPVYTELQNYQSHYYPPPQSHLSNPHHTSPIYNSSSSITKPSPTSQFTGSYVQNYAPSSQTRPFGNNFPSSSPSPNPHTIAGSSSLSHPAAAAAAPSSSPLSSSSSTSSTGGNGMYHHRTSPYTPPSCSPSYPNIQSNYYPTWIPPPPSQTASSTTPSISDANNIMTHDAHGHPLAHAHPYAHAHPHAAHAHQMNVQHVVWPHHTYNPSTGLTSPPVSISPSSYPASMGVSMPIPISIPGPQAGVVGGQLVPIQGPCVPGMVAASMNEVMADRSGRLIANHPLGRWTVRGKNEMYLSLYNGDMWSRFHAHINEMIITKHGRRMFPVLHFLLGGLDPKKHYHVWVDMVIADNSHWKFQGGKWVSGGTAEPMPPEGRAYHHPDSPNTGTHWMKQDISFGKLKLTNNKSCKQKQIILNSMHRYQPRVYVAEDVNGQQGELVVTHAFNDTQFMAVTAYQNMDITQLKIDNNPFAKGFRDNFESRMRVNESPNQEGFQVLPAHPVLPPAVGGASGGPTGPWCATVPHNAVAYPHIMPSSQAVDPRTAATAAAAVAVGPPASHPALMTMAEYSQQMVSSSMTSGVQGVYQGTPCNEDPYSGERQTGARVGIDQSFLNIPAAVYNNNLEANDQSMAYSLQATGSDSRQQQQLQSSSFNSYYAQHYYQQENSLHPASSTFGSNSSNTNIAGGDYRNSNNMIENENDSSSDYFRRPEHSTVGKSGAADYSTALVDWKSNSSSLNHAANHRGNLNDPRSLYGPGDNNTMNEIMTTSMTSDISPNRRNSYNNEIESSIAVPNKIIDSSNHFLENGEFFNVGKSIMVAKSSSPESDYDNILNNFSSNSGTMQSTDSLPSTYNNSYSSSKPAGSFLKKMGGFDDVKVELEVSKKLNVNSTDTSSVNYATGNNSMEMSSPVHFLNHVTTSPYHNYNPEQTVAFSAASSSSLLSSSSSSSSSSSLSRYVPVSHTYTRSSGISQNHTPMEQYPSPPAVGGDTYYYPRPNSNAQIFPTFYNASKATTQSLPNSGNNNNSNNNSNTSTLSKMSYLLPMTFSSREDETAAMEFGQLQKQAAELSLDFMSKDVTLTLSTTSADSTAGALLRPTSGQNSSDNINAQRTTFLYPENKSQKEHEQAANEIANKECDDVPSSKHSKKLSANQPSNKDNSANGTKRKSTASVNAKITSKKSKRTQK